LAAVVAVDPAVVDEPADAVVAVLSLLDALSLSSPPQAAIVATIAKATVVAAANRRFPLMDSPSRAPCAPARRAPFSRARDGKRR